MTAMATWEDGPEYAPTERPAAFAEPAVGIGLEAPPPAPPAPVLPAQQPAFDGPPQPGPPLAALVQEPPAVRDPQQPFDVASSVMTAESSAWASAHWAPPQSQSTGQSGPTGQTGSTGLAAPSAPVSLSPSQRPNAPAPPLSFPPPTGGPSYPAPVGAPTYPPPTGGPAYPPSTSGPAYPPPPSPPSPYATYPTYQPFPAPGQPPAQGPFPAPGTTQWFAPGSYPQQQPLPAAAPDARTVLTAATPGVLIALVVGGFIWVLAPITLVIAFVLTRRMTYARKAAHTAFAAAMACLGIVGLVSIFTADGLFLDWWDSVARWGCVASWVMLVVVLILVYRAVKQGRPDPPVGMRFPQR